MKKGLLFLLTLICVGFANATNYFWIGGTTTANLGVSGTLSTSSGGSNAGAITLAATDVVTFDGNNIGLGNGVTGNVTFQASAAITVGQMLFINSANVTYSCSSSGRNININGSISGTDFFNR